MTEDQYLDKLYESGPFSYEALKQSYRSGAIQGLNKGEMELLEFCSGRDMHAYIKEEVGDKPIVLNPDGSVNWEKTKFRPKTTLNEDSPTQQGTSIYDIPQSPMAPVNPVVIPDATSVEPQTQEMPQVDKQKFYYLYDDSGNLIAALPKN